MNDAMVKERARERLLSAELAEVLEIDVAAIDAVAIASRKPHRWLAAALVLLGIAVAGGVAWLRAHDVHEVQQREFDPTDPWWERGLSVMVGGDNLRSANVVAALPPESSEFTVNQYLGSGPDAIDAVLARPRVETLSWIAGTTAYDPDAWRRLLTHGELRRLCLGGPDAGLSASQLRELRLLPELQQLGLVMKGIALDADVASALVELPKLRELLILGNAVLPEGLQRLDGLPHLDTLGLFGFGEGDANAIVRAASRVRTLRALLLEGFRSPIDPDALASLRDLRGLIALDLSHCDLTDEHLAALPDTLQALQVSNLQGVSVTGLKQLDRMRGLRSLGVRAGLPEKLKDPLRRLVERMEVECFELGVEVPDEQLWRTLQSLPRLRRLRVHDQSIGDAMPAARRDVFEQARRCDHLEVLIFRTRELPMPDELAVLRDHPTLRRVRIERSERFAAGQALTPDHLAAVRDAAGCEVEVQ
ncbi:MAG: hypothetical protein H6835_03445 [Planctomycetes bacterium]|nr:hypothetical protein [Planctomycetota bacterium]